MSSAKGTATPTWWIASTASLIWLLCSIGNYWLKRHTRLPAEFVDLLSPAPLAHIYYRIPQPWPVALVTLWMLAVAALTFMLLRTVHSRAARGDTPPTQPGFAASWICVGFAGILSTLLVCAGAVIADWPPARLAWIFQDIQPAVGVSAYWAFLYGWVPAAILKLRSARRSVPEKPASAVGKSLFLSLLVSSLLISSVIVGRNAGIAASQTPVATPEPVPTPSYVVYGSPEFSEATVDADPTWCASEQVSVLWGQGDAATGHRALTIELENQSATSCVLNSYPDVAFDDTDGAAMEVLLVHGGSFMTEDQGLSEIKLAPGERAVAHLGWNAMAAATDTSAGSMLVAPYRGALRHKNPTELDIVNGGAVTITAWERAPSDSAPRYVPKRSVHGTDAGAEDYCKVAVSRAALSTQRCRRGRLRHSSKVSSIEMLR